MSQILTLKHQSQCDFVSFMGDVHGDWSSMYSKFKDYDFRDCVVFQVGDFGVGWETVRKELRALRYWNGILANRNIHLYVLRGNHDDPAYYDGTRMFSHIKLLPDYTVVEIGAWRVLVIGGAHSVDRTRRNEYFIHKDQAWMTKRKQLNRGWWPEEVFDFKPDILDGLRDIDFVATHTAPAMCMPMSKSILHEFARYDDDLIDDVAQERMNMNLTFEILRKNNPLYAWYYGHYHDSHTMGIFETTFHMLDIDEIVEEKIMRNAI